MDRCGFNMFHSTKEGHCADFHVSTWPSRILSAFRHGSNWHGQPKSPTLVPTSGECNIHRCFNPSLSLSIHKLNVLNLSVWEWKASSSISIFQAPGWFYTPQFWHTQWQVLTAFNREVEVVPEPRVVVETRGRSDPAADTFWGWKKWAGPIVATRGPCPWDF